MLGVFVILGVGGIALLTGRRQAEERPSPDPDQAPDEPLAPAFVRRAAAGPLEGAADRGRRGRATWEVYSSLENEPLGSSDELPPEGAMSPARDLADHGELGAKAPPGPIDARGDPDSAEPIGRDPFEDR